MRQLELLYLQPHKYKGCQEFIATQEFTDFKKPRMIQEYESGKAIPNQQVLGKLERALAARLVERNEEFWNETEQACKKYQAWQVIVFVKIYFTK